MNNTPITTQEIDDLMADVLDTLEDTRARVELVQAVTLTVPFDTARLKERESEVRALLDRVDPIFLETGGRGCCASRFPCPGITGPRSEALIALGIAVGKVKWLAPRSSWGVMFPNGDPYLVVLAEPGQLVAPAPPLFPAAKPFLGLVPWVTNSPGRLYKKAKRLVKIKVRPSKKP